MTSASELFYTRRSRVGRADQDLGLDSLTPERTFPNRRHHQTTSASTHRHDLDGCDLLRRSPHLRHISHRPSHTERASARFDQGASQFVSSNPINREMSRSTSRPSLNGNERLPGAVLLARARLLERLRGVSISPNRSVYLGSVVQPSFVVVNLIDVIILPFLFHRRSGRISFGGYQEENIFGDELSLVEAGDWGAETSTGSSTRGSPFAEFTAEIERLQIMQEAKRKKPPGLTKEALDCLHLEVFNNYEIGMEAELSKAALDCSICLESFVDGDELIRLPCQHRFHSACLDPWVRSCGDCPYCRRDILVNSHKAIERT
ncbi:hypothetical protein EZV62_011159 [Acer yangbiense]|uniref:RING-type domain-containing protein n=1 Tax=Acer yangbiense TaxID=1000413 RepID=A0A5C7I4W8_9ROSI|nr:hypothetical protein EZV62_011159 [Acer yangbiense]